MKRQRPKSFSPGSFQAEGRNRKGKTLYVCDNKLLPRVRQLFHGYSKEKLPSLDELVGCLQEKYGEYSRKKKSAFRISVQKVYQTIKNESAEEKKLQELEERFLGKRKDQTDFLPIDIEENSEDGLNISSDSELTDEEMRVDVLNGNLVNESMHEMYRTSNSRRNSEEEDEEALGIDMERKSDLPLLQKDKDNSVILDNSNSNDVDILKENKNLKKCDDSVHATISDNGTCISRTNDLSRNENTSNTNLILKRDNISMDNNTPDNKTKRRLHSSSVKSGKKRHSQTTSGDKRKSKNENNQLEDATDRIPSVPLLKFSDLGGCDECIEEVCKLLIHIKHPEVFKILGITPPRGFLLHGPPGCGKTLLAHAIAGELDIPLVNVASTEMVSGVSGESEGKIRDLFSHAVSHAPCVLFLDEIDAITPKRETASKEMERRIVAQLLSCLDELNRNQQAQVVVIGATNRPDSLDPALRRAGRFDREIRMGIPDEKAREKILIVQCKALKLSGEFDFKAIAEKTPGFVGADLMAVAREAAMCAVTRIFCGFKNDKRTSDTCMPSLETENTGVQEMSNERSPLSIMAWLKSNETCFSEEQLKDLSIEMEDFTKALQEVQPSAKREGFATIPGVTWDDIGALEDVREELTMAIIAPVRHRKTFTELGLTNPPGILLAGPPGCGKTLLAKAIANESGINFISVKGPELLNMYVGESERAVRQVFQRARNSAPCVIFFDELDALCPRRSDSAESNASARVVNQLLTEMDGLETRKQVFIMAATNRPDIIDPAILRPGRLDKILYIGLPREVDRSAILKTLTKQGTKPKLLEDVDLMTIASDERCHGFSGADLAALVREACMNSLRECMKGSTMAAAMVWETGATENCESEGMQPHHVGVGMRHFDLALQKIRPSVSQKEQLIYQRIVNKTVDK